MRLLGRKLRNARGDSFISVLVAAGLLGGTAMVGGGVVKLMRRETTYSAVMGTAISAESTILQTLQSPNFFANPTHAAELRSGGTNLLAGSAINGELGQVAVLGSAFRMTRLGRPCNAGRSDAQSEDFCAITTNVQINCDVGGECRAAYQVAIDTAANAGVSVPPFGSVAWPPRPYQPANPTAAHDFTMVISYDLYRRVDSALSCQPNELFVAAVDKSNGSVTCARPAVNTLPPNQIPSGVVYNMSTESLELTARTTGQLACSDPRYALQTVDPRSLDQGQAANGACVYRFNPDIPWMSVWPDDRDSVTANVCPQSDYDVAPSGACQMEVISTTNGYCPKVCQDGSGNWYDCSEEVPPDMSYRIDQDPPVGVVRRAGAQVSCTLVQTGTQRCGSSWRGKVRWDGRCLLNQPTPIPAVGR